MTKARMTNGCAKCPRPNEEGPIPKAFGAKSKARAWLGIWVLELLWALGICHRAFHQGGCLSGRAGGRGYPCGMGNMDWNGRSGRRWTKNGTRLRGDAAARSDDGASRGRIPGGLAARLDERPPRPYEPGCGFTSRSGSPTRHTRRGSRARRSPGRAPRCRRLWRSRQRGSR